ncbi:hypothetical protein ACTMTJ_20620 [Phytohabitans sp. LJ34]|uniref:hypothetical protein n=1 Tax=Phytohabitans sp. LJ34 TaxID=3452217 RepID=UPI003F896D9D
MRSRLARLLAATLLAVPLMGLASPGTASAGAPGAAASKSALAEGWIYWSWYPDATSCILTGATLAYPGSPIYAAYYCEEDYNPLRYELFLYKRF